MNLAKEIQATTELLRICEEDDFASRLRRGCSNGGFQLGRWRPRLWALLLRLRAGCSLRVNADIHEGVCEICATLHFGDLSLGLKPYQSYVTQKFWVDVSFQLCVRRR